MNGTDEHLARIKTRLQQLLKQFALLQKENQQLRDEIGRLRTERAAVDEQLADLKQKNEVLQFSQGYTDEAGKKEMEKRLNAYIREIDRCIAVLGQ